MNSDMPAMPVQNTSDYYPGMTKREYFAKVAMQGLLAYYGDGQSWESTAREAVACSDALLRELEETK